MLKRTNLRTDKVFDKYVRKLKQKPVDEDIECVLCSAKSTKEYKFWRIVINDFPYDNIAQNHNMLIPKRHVGVKDDLCKKELKEMDNILDSLDKENFFDAILENLNKNRTIKQHLHLHLIKYIKY